MSVLTCEPIFFTHHPNVTDRLAAQMIEQYANYSRISTQLHERYHKHRSDTLVERMARQMTEAIR